MQNEKRRIWPVVLFLSSLVATVVLGGLMFFRASQPDSTSGELNVAPYERATEPRNLATTSSSPVTKATPTKMTLPPRAIKPSTPTELFVPNARKDLAISAKIKSMTCGGDINPPLDGNVYSCADRDQPGTIGTFMSVLAGHSSEKPSLDDLAFNRLYVQGDSLKGKELFVRTEASGDKLLKYRVQSIHTPLKGDLATLPIIPSDKVSQSKQWLVIVTCLQRGPNVPSLRNYVVVASLEGIQ